MLWTPHWGERRDQAELSTFLRWRDLVMAIFKERDDMVLIIRPHPFLFEQLVEQQLMMPDEIAAWKEGIARSSNVWLDELWDFRSAFHLSNGLMADAGSFLMLYGFTKKPLLYLKNPRGPGLEEDQQFVQNYYVGQKDEDIARFVGMVHNAEDPLQTVRVKDVYSSIFMPETGSGFFIKEHVVHAVRRGV